MSRVFGTVGPAHPRLGKLGQRLTRPLFERVFRARGVYRAGSRYARERAAAMRSKLERGETVYLLGAVPAGQNAGVALVEVSPVDGIRLLCNEEEERYSGIRYYGGYPESGVDAVRERLAEMGLSGEDIHACVAGWDYVSFLSSGIRVMLEHAPASFALARKAAAEEFNAAHAFAALRAPVHFGRQLELPRPLPIIGLRHHDNHAALAFGASPFAAAGEPVMVTVLDGYGDDAAISLYLAKDGKLARVDSNDSPADSLGGLYAVVSSTQGGWPPLHSEGRFMGAAAWGNGERLTNPFYRQLREIVHFESEGRIHINRSMVNWHLRGEMDPYKEPLRKILGRPIPRSEMWNPDAVLKVDDVAQREVSAQRVDKAAALQLVFEDALFHVVGHLIRSTGSHRLVMAGGTALNCVANMKLLEQFDESFYRRYLGKRARLHLWVPPIPGDAGAAAGAAYNFALSAGGQPGPPLSHAFLCGRTPGAAEILDALEESTDIGYLRFGNVRRRDDLEKLADFAATLVANDGVLGIFQGRAETGPRALGHRSILANPVNPETLANINKLVKFREPFRPLAPMATYEAARRYFDLAEGASDAEHNAYNYMVLTCRARPEAKRLVPAVVHRDGTSRVQIVREAHDSFCHAYLKAMGRRAGVEISVNTSLNVGSPIVQSPSQALRALERAKAMHGLILIADEGDAFLAWHDVDRPPKDAGRFLRTVYERWRAQTPSAGAVVATPPSEGGSA